MGKNKKATGKKKNTNNNGNHHQQQQQNAATINVNGEDGGFLYIDPARIRFQHSRIRPYFSGCGRSVVGTLESIRRGEITPDHLPPIQVIVGPTVTSNDKKSENDEQQDDGQQGPWYFSLNNRRLWVLKRCREEGLLQSSNNLIRVRVRAPKSAAERDRYSIEKCALEAKIVPEKQTAATAPVSLSKINDNTIMKRDNNDCEETTHAATTTTTPGSSLANDMPSSERTEEVMKGGCPFEKNSGSAEDEDDDDSSSSSSSGGFASTNPFSVLSR